MSPLSPQVIAFDGPLLQAENLEKTKSMLYAAVETGSPNLVMDFSEVEYVDSSFLGLLIRVLRLVKSKGGEIKLCRMSSSIYSIFKLMALTRVFDIHDTREGALKAFE